MVVPRIFLVATAVCAGVAVPARGDVFELKDGGRVVGTTIGHADNGSYVVKTADGAELTLDRKQLQRVVPQDEAAAEYQRRSRSAPDTAAAHRELAAWCREHGLVAEADHHLRRVV